MNQAAALQQQPRVVVGAGQRITPPTVTQSKVALEVCAPALIGLHTVRQRVAISGGTMAPASGLDQAGSFEDLSRGAIGRPGPVWLYGLKAVEHLLGAKARMREFHLHDAFTHLGRCLVGMVVGVTREFLEAINSLLVEASNPLISRGSADFIPLTQLHLGVLAAEPVTNKLNSLVHRTGLFPGHRHVLLADNRSSDVNHVPGLMCKGCYRSVPTSVALPEGTHPQKTSSPSGA